MSDSVDGGGCAICDEPYSGDGAPEYGEILQHLADEHPRSDILLEAVDMVTATATCSGCGECFQSGVNVAQERGEFIIGDHCGSCIQSDPILGAHTKTITGHELADEYGMSRGGEVTDD